MNSGSETIFTISRAWGAFPFEMSSNGVSIPKRQLCYCLLLLAIALSDSTLAGLQESARFAMHPNLKRTIHYRTSIHLSAVVFSFVFLFPKRHKLLTLVRQLKAIDAQLTGVGVTISDRAKYKWLDTVVIAVFFILVVGEARASVSLGNCTLGGSVVGGSLYFISSCRYYGTINCVSEPAEEILERLETIVRFTKKPTGTVPLSCKALSRLETMAKCAFDLSKSALVINEIFAPQIVLVTSDLFSRILSLGYVCANIVVNTSDAHFTSYVWQEMCLAVLFTKTLLCPLSRVTKQFTVYHSTLYRKLLEFDVESSLTEKLKFHLYSKRNVVFSGFGIFQVDLPLLHSMAAAIASYLVVLLQLQYSSQASSLD